MVDDNKLTKSWGDFLRKRTYDAWLTVTFTQPTTVDQAKIQLKRFLKRLNTKEKTFFTKCVRLWTFYEKNRFDNGVHLHCLIENFDVSNIPELQERCNAQFGLSTAMEVHPGVIPYIAQKFDSESLADYDYMKVNSRCRTSHKNRNTNDNTTKSHKS